MSSEKPTETESEISELIHRLHQLPSPLLDWYSQQKRDLPWRADRDPYRIWVSEVMLQQTRVDTVIPYFSRLIAAYPDICSLAHADEQSLLRIWEGLGYYRRARDLRAAACLLRDNHAGRFPQDPAIVLSLPGFGRYTTNAVLSQAFDLRLPILEANTLRLLSRLIGSEEDPRQGAANRKLWHIAEAILPERDVGEFNQALMELGALVCLPTPKCASCPIREFCDAFQTNRQEQIPCRTPKPPPTLVREVAVVLRCGDRVLLCQRPKDGRWANLWEFPHEEVREAESAEEAAIRVARALSGEQETAEAKRIGELKHSVTRYRITLSCYEMSVEQPRHESGFYVQGKWLQAEELIVYPVSSPQRRLAKLIQKRRQQPELFD